MLLQALPKDSGFSPPRPFWSEKATGEELTSIAFFFFFLVDNDIYRGDGISTESEFESPASRIGLHCFLASFSLYLFY